MSSLQSQLPDLTKFQLFIPKNDLKGPSQKALTLSKLANSKLIPEKSSPIYWKNYRLYECFCQDNTIFIVDEDSALAYFECIKDKFAPTRDFFFNENYEIITFLNSQN